MDSETFDGIIDFAIAREKEAVIFYRELQEKMQFANQKDTLKDFELMEQGHITMLEKIRSQGEAIGAASKPIPDLHISDYLVESEPSADMSYQDILITAMKKEESALKLYSTMADKSADADIGNLFRTLAAEEAKHKLHFETVYDDEILKEN